MGISPNIIALRCDEPLEPEIFRKIAMFCNVKPDCVIENRTLPNLYEAPLMLESHDFSLIVCRELGLWTRAPELTEWRAMVQRSKSADRTVTIGLVGKYVQLHDAYLSVAEALRHAGFACGAKVDIRWIDSETVTPETAPAVLAGCDGLIVPGGFGDRGVEGMIATAQYAREKDIPYLGICLGMQVAVIEFARHVCGIPGATSGELDADAEHKVIDFLPDQSDSVSKGGTLRLGAWPCRILDHTRMRACYGEEEIRERHRHRYEFNNGYREILSDAGMCLCGQSPDGKIVEAVELSEKRFFVGVQFHPEFHSRPNRPHPLFVGLIRASLGTGFSCHSSEESV